MPQGTFSFDEPEAPEALETIYARVTPRDYQSRSVLEGFRHFDRHPGALVRQPTGTGKTVIGSLFADRWLSQSNRSRVFVMAHERQLVWQFAQEVEDILGIRPAIEMGSRRVVPPQEHGDMPLIIVACRASLIMRTVVDEATGEKIPTSRLYKFSPEDYDWLVMVDEAHRYARKLKSVGHIFSWFDRNPNSKRIGLTATPERTDGVSLSELFPAVASDFRLYDPKGGPSAVSEGWAVGYDQRFVTVHGVDFTNLKEVRGDFDDEELDAMLNTKTMLASLIQPMVDLVGDRRTLIFSPTVSMAKAVAEYLCAEVADKCSYPNVAVSMSGSTPEDVRRAVYQEYEDDQFQFLSVCGLCREGYNSPGIGAVAIFRPTKSRSLAEQMKGRGCRTLRGLIDSNMTREQRLDAIASSKKPDCMIVDLVGVSGLADTATTAEIYAEGIEDDIYRDVVDLANEMLLSGETTNAPEAVKRARSEIEEQREEARRRHELAERKARELAEKRAKLHAEVTYDSTQVRQGQGARNNTSFGRCTASPKQLEAMRKHGIDFDPSRITSAIAGRVMGQIVRGMSAKQIQESNRLGTSNKASNNNSTSNLTIDEVNAMLQERRK